MRQRKHPRPNQRGSHGERITAKKSASKSPVVYRRQRLTRMTLGIVVLMLISFIGMSYTNKVDGWLPKPPAKAKAPAPTTTLPAHKAA